MTKFITPFTALLTLGLLLPVFSSARSYDPSLAILPMSKDIVVDDAIASRKRRTLAADSDQTASKLEEIPKIMNKMDLRPSEPSVEETPVPVADPEFVSDEFVEAKQLQPKAKPFEPIGSPNTDVKDAGNSNEVSLQFFNAPTVTSPTDEADAEFVLADDEKITVNYPNQEIRSILRNVADIFELNLVVPDTLLGSTSIKLRDVTWRQVFDIVLRPVGFAFTEESNIVRVVSIEQISQEPMTIRTFPIRYAKAADVATSLGPIIQGKGGSIQVDNRSNTIIVKDRPSVLLEIDNLLKTSILDKAALQVMIETKFIEVSKEVGGDSTSDGLGLRWWDAGAVLGSGNNFLRAMGQLDIFNNFGGSKLATAVFSNTEYKMVLDALETTACANLVANPTVVTLNNEQATFHVGKNQPIITANFDQTTGNFTVGEVDYLPVGVRVDVTPRINSGAEQITLNVRPKVSKIIDQLEFKAAGGGVITYPIEQIRETETNVSIKNGYTLALGGLIQDDEVTKVEKVPYLGDIPFIGALFRRTVNSVDKTNLIMFITAKTLNPDGSTFNEIIDPRLIAQMGISDADLPGYWDGHDKPGMSSMADSHKRLLDDLREYRTLNDDEDSQRYFSAEMLKNQERAFNYRNHMDRRSGGGAKHANGRAYSGRGF